MSEILNIILGFIAIVATGGWFVFYKSNKALKTAEVSKATIELKEANFAFYIKNIADLENRLSKAMEKQLEFEKQIDKLEKKIKKYEQKYGCLD